MPFWSMKFATAVQVYPVVLAMEDVFVSCQQGDILLDTPDIDSLLQGVDILYAISRIPKQELADWFVKHNDTIHSVNERTTKKEVQDLYKVFKTLIRDWN